MICRNKKYMVRVSRSGLLGSRERVRETKGVRPMDDSPSPWLTVSSPGGGSKINYDWWIDRTNELGGRERADVASGSALSRKPSRRSGPISIPLTSTLHFIISIHFSIWLTLSFQQTPANLSIRITGRKRWFVREQY